MNIVTHDGIFHADEVLACALLDVFLEPTRMDIVRTRDEQALKLAKENPDTYVIDVGGEYNPDMLNFDHHQREFKHTSADKIPLSSAGLVLNHLTGLGVVSLEQKNYLRNVLVNGVDAIDTGYDAPKSKNDKIQWATFSNLISNMNHSRDIHSPLQCIEFYRAVDFAKTIVKDMLRRLAFIQDSKAALQTALKEQAGLQIIKLPSECASIWQNTLIQDKNHENAKFVVFDSGDNFKVMQIPSEPGSFKGRISLPESWHGLSGESLDEVTGIEGGVFVHRNGFIGGWKTEKAALEAAVLAIVSHNMITNQV